VIRLSIESTLSHDIRDCWRLAFEI